MGSALVRAFESMGSRVWVVSRMPGPSHISWVSPDAFETRI